MKAQGAIMGAGAEGNIGRGTEQPEHTLCFTVLGPVRAHRGDQELSMGSPQQRALLAALLLRGGHTATAEELIDALWGEEPPDQAKATLRTYAFRIRKALGDDAELLVSESGGYAIRTGRAVSDVSLDLDVATALVAEAEKSAASGDRSRARDSYAAALAQFSGEPLASVPGPFAERQRSSLAEWQLTLQEHRIDLDLQLAGHTEAVSELTALTAAHPLRERLRELLMLALYRSGRQAEALAVFADTRRLLADELGVDPCAELTGLHQRILEADDGLALAPDEPSGPATPKPAQPAQLPAAVADFTGRKAFVAELKDQLAQAEGTVMALSAVAGIGGVGKTTLAVHVAHAAAEHFPDGQLYVDLQGAGPSAAEPEAVLGAFLRSLGVEDTGIPDGVAERSALFRSLLSGRRILTLLDNARDAAQVRPLLAGAAGCAALVTSRTRMTDLAGAHLIDLDVMSPDEAMTLFTRIVGEERVTAERQAAMAVVGACGFLPLAIRIAAARLASRRTWTVAVLAEKLADERRRLDELQVGDQAVKATFELGYGQLDAEQARGFRLLGLADGPDISLHAAAALLDRPAGSTESLLESLVDASLLESAAPGRYRFHDLVRLFARACAERDEQPPSEREAAFSRLLDFYLATASKVFALERPGERAVDHLTQPCSSGLRFADRDAALAWLFSEADCVLACVQQAAERGLLRHAADLLIAVKDCADSGVHSLRYERAAATVRDAAREAGDVLAEARTQIMLTHVHIVAGRFDQADQEAERATLLAGASGDVLAGCWSLNDRGIVANCQQRYSDGEAYLLRAIDAFREDRNRPSEASALCNLAQICLAMGQTDRGIQLAEQGLEIYEALDQGWRTANARYVLGRALTHGGHVEEGLEQLNQAASLFHESRQPLWEGVSNFRIAEAHLAARRPAQAAGHAEQALALRGIGGEWMRGRMLTVLGRALVALGQRDRARVCWKDALAIFEEMGASDADEVRALLTPAQAA
jgi:DNA-binding SARP family transcriptional activator/tetratricopeptide (TPR) repeat protein